MSDFYKNLFFILSEGDIEIFPSQKHALDYLEEVDVVNGVYDYAFDGAGKVFSIEVSDDKSILFHLDKTDWNLIRKNRVNYYMAMLRNTKWSVIDYEVISTNLLMHLALLLANIQVYNPLRRIINSFNLSFRNLEEDIKNHYRKKFPEPDSLEKEHIEMLRFLEVCLLYNYGFFSLSMLEQFTRCNIKVHFQGSIEAGLKVKDQVCNDYIRSLASIISKGEFVFGNK